ncbi:MAG: hypothetical protein JW867_05945, partial [Candidatus Omnitrophica bacterium]|nr:hypothetical protein [Candidatus Omnitrophota bacterium]
MSSKQIKDNIFLHSFYLIFSKISLGISGIIFWWVASRFYSIEDIGLGSALISCGSLLIFLSSLGIIPTFIRFLPQQKEKDSIFETFWSLSFFLLVIFCLIFFILINFFIPQF